MLNWEEKLQRDALVAAFWTWCADCQIVAEVDSLGNIILSEQSTSNEDELIEAVIRLDRYEG